METVLESTYLCFKLLSPSHGLQLLWCHLICNLNASHLLHHLFQYQQVKTEEREKKRLKLNTFMR